MTLSNPAGATLATLADDTATGTITDDDTQLPALSIADADPGVTEGATAQFEVTLSAESQQVVTVAYATADGTAVEDSDYTQTSGTLTFAAGETTKTIPVPTIDDDEQESEEHFTVTLSSPEGATLDDSSGQGTITDNDGEGPALPQLSIADASAAEGDTVQFTVTLTGTSNQTVTVDFQTGDGTAKAGSDYTAASGTVTFTAGETTRSISVATLEDTIREEDETFSVTLTNPAGATLADDTATGTITDDDTQLPALSIADAEPVTEGATAQFEVTLSAESQQVVTVAYATADGTAVEDSDYTQTSGTLTFAAGETTKTIPVPTIDDDEQESEEHFTVTLSSPEGATLDDSSGQGTITDDDGNDTTPRLYIVDASADEGDAVRFRVVLTGDSDRAVTVDFETDDGTALAGSDYEETSGTLTFAVGTETQTISVPTHEDDSGARRGGRDLHGEIERRGRGDDRRRQRTRNDQRQRRRRRPPAHPHHRGCRAGRRGRDGAVLGHLELPERAGGDRLLRNGGRDGERRIRLHVDHGNAAVRAGRYDRDDPGDGAGRRDTGGHRELHGGVERPGGSGAGRGQRHGLDHRRRRGHAAGAVHR